MLRLTRVAAIAALLWTAVSPPTIPLSAAAQGGLEEVNDGLSRPRAHKRLARLPPTRPATRPAPSTGPAAPRTARSSETDWASACPGHGGQGLLARQPKPNPMPSAVAVRNTRRTQPAAKSGWRLCTVSFAAGSRGDRSRLGSGRSGVAPLTRAAAEARRRRGRRDRQRATSWRSAEEGRGRVGGRCERRWPAPAGCRRRDGCGCHRRPCG